MFGLGIDLVHIPTLAKIMQRNSAFKTATFTAEEIAYCEARGARAAQHFAARFAAKEAYWKASQSHGARVAPSNGTAVGASPSRARCALATRVIDNPTCTWTDIAVVRSADGVPRLEGPAITSCVALVSLSHHGEYATAAVMLVPNALAHMRAEVACSAD